MPNAMPNAMGRDLGLVLAVSFRAGRSVPSAAARGIRSAANMPLTTRSLAYPKCRQRKGAAFQRPPAPVKYLFEIKCPRPAKTP
jgi:hypothetical protein